MADGPKPVASMTGAAFFGINRTVDAERQTGIRAVGDASGCSGGTMGFHRCRCARCLYERGEGPKPPPVLPGVEFAKAKAGPAPSAEYAAECRGCEACPDGICSRHHPDDREAAMRAHPEPKVCAHEMTALDTVEGGTFCLDCGGKPASERKLDPKAAPVDPYEAHAIKALADAADDFIVKLGEDEEPKTRAEALAQAEEALTEGRRVLAFATAGVARLERAIAEHGRKAGGAK